MIKFYYKRYMMFTKYLLQNKFIYDLLLKMMVYFKYLCKIGLRKISQSKWGGE